MKFKLLLLLFLVSAFYLRAKEPYQNLIFSEVRMDTYHHSYVELCNMGKDTIDLSEFDVGSVSPWSTAPWDTVNAFSRAADGFVKLPQKKLKPGGTFLIATVRDWGDEQAILHPLENAGSNTKHDMWMKADMQIHAAESPAYDPTDSISTGANALVCWGGTYCFYLMHHFTKNDSIVVDAVNGVFTSSSSTRPLDYGPSDVAGVPDATGNSILVRKYSVTKGTTDWEKTRGVDLTDSEWLPVPTLSNGGWEMGRKEFWTIGNHGDYRLNATSLKSNSIKIDWTNKTMDVDWGARRQDSIMNEFEYADGIAWKYSFTRSKIDSAYTSVRTGDSLTLYACGKQMDIMKFGLKLLPPIASECRVLPKNSRNNNGTWNTPFVVSEYGSIMDTIFTGYSARVDTLFKYLEKPEKAKWEIVWVDGIKRPDLKKGDKLKITAENGSSTKEYYIKAQQYIPSHNANLASITWPDIPEELKGIYGWKGDTIPDFSPTKFNYVVKVPANWNGIPALIAKPQDPDCKIEVVRATSLFGSDDAKTIKFYTTAEDDTTLLTYRVRLEKEMDVSNAQPFSTEPFFSELVFRAGWRQFFLEICNPGNQPLDLSNYVITRSVGQNPGAAIRTASTTTDWPSRFNRYVPGFVWQDEASWQVVPGILQPDLSVNPIVEGGDVFVLAWAFPNDQDATTFLYPAFEEADVNFKNGYNPWGIEFTTEDANANYVNICGGWHGSDWILYKIVGDSVREGLKPLGDPNDVVVIDVLGRCSGSNWGLIQLPSTAYDQNSGLTRLPNIYKGNPEPGGSFPDTITNRPSEWFYHTEAYWTAQGYTVFPQARNMICNDIGSQELDPITEFISTVASASYTVSKGYSMNETIGGGVQTGTTVDQFMQRIITIEGQTITLTRGTTVLTGADVLQNGDQLTVVSRNKDNTSRYTINVTAQGLDINARLTSSKYTIAVNGSNGTISGFNFGVTLKEVFNNCTPPANAALYGAFKSDGSYAPFVQMKHDSTYADVIASDNIFFEVIAQDGETKITYQLKPNSLSSEAFVISEVFNIDQTALMIKLIPDNTSVQGLFAFLTAAPGATFVLQNNMGQIREDGTIYKDDKLVVTAADGVTKKTYTLELWSDFAKRYEAFVYSDVYQVVSTGNVPKISGVSAETPQETFLANIRISEGATYVLLDNKGAAKTTTTMANNDRVVVTSENGLSVRTYRVGIKTSVVDFNNNSVFAYPNPTTGMLTILGLQKDNIISVVNLSGQVVMKQKVYSDRESLSLEKLPNGFYLINVDYNNQQVAKIKVIKK